MDREHLNEVYGRRTGQGASSVNGTSALADLFKQAGHRVRSWRYLSPSLDDADVIVWFPHERWGSSSSAVGAPAEEAVDWLDDWLLYSDEGKTLILVGQDWQAGPEYWSQTQGAAPAAQQAEFGRRLREAQREESNRLAAKIAPLECDWLTIERGNPKTTVKQLTGKLVDAGDAFAPAEAKIDPVKANLEHWSSLQVRGEDARPLLADGQGHPLVTEVPYLASEVGWANEDSRLIVVENGSFLLNGALTNHERRKLAGRLIAHLGSSRQRVIFLETGPAPTIRDTDPNPRPPTGLELFGIWPVGAVLAQVAALFVVYACARWPIFGVPRRLKDPSLTDFGRHVHALARLLAATRDRAYAVTQLNTYFKTGSHRPRSREGGAPAEPGPANNPTTNADSARAAFPR